MAKEAPELENILNVNIELEKAEGEQFTALKPNIKIDMSDDDKALLNFIMDAVDRELKQQFPQVFAIESHLQMKVRTPLPPHAGHPGWVMNQDGSYLEDWSKITTKDLEEFIQAGASEIFFATQKVIDSYATAIVAKYSYDDAYDLVYSSLKTGTIDDKRSNAKRKTYNERWVALVKTIYYKKANELVRKLDEHVRRMERVYSERQKESERAFRASRQ